MPAIAAAALVVVAGCETPPPQKPAPPPAPPPDSVAVPVPAAPSPVPQPTAPASGRTLRQTTWEDLPEWSQHDASPAWHAFLRSCVVLVNQAAWYAPCSLARQSRAPDAEAVRRFFQSHFVPYQVVQADGGGSDGLITGYYEPLLQGSRRPSERYRHPIYAVPEDLLTVDLSEIYPELKGKRLRGRLEGRRVVPYYDRAQIESGRAPVRGREIAWVDDPVDLFFLQVQGSGRIQLEDGQTLRVGYADQNGHPYRSIGKWLVERGELPLEKASMQGIKAWARQNSDRLPELLNHNARYVFFRELPGDLPGPLGALGVPLTAGRSIAIDARHVPMGAPVYIATTWPNTARTLNRLMLAQDAGGAIQGAVRADFFWGFGDDAGRQAGRMKQGLRMWVLLPKGFPITAR